MTPRRGRRAPVLFTPGPVMMTAKARRAAAVPLPYFRTQEFSEILLRSERLLLETLEAGPGWRSVALTASGTAAMEAAVTGLFGPEDPLIVVNGGGFGERFAEICRFHGYAFEELRVEPGKNIPDGALDRFRNRGFRGLLVNHHETTTGQLYDLKTLGRFAKENGLFLIVDAVSSFLADPLSLAGGNIDAVILSSQKGLALHPGLSLLALSPRLVRRVEGRKGRSYYLDLRFHLQNGSRGQTPFTPAIGVILQMEKALVALAKTGPEARVRAVKRLAQDFRKKIVGLPFALFAENPSNAVTALKPANGRSAAWYVDRLRDDFGYYVCPNGEPLKETVFRVGHLGDLSPADNTRLVNALKKLSRIKQDRRLAA